MTTSLLILDSRVAAAYVPANLPVGMRLVILDPSGEGLAQLAAAATGERDLAAIHIVSHGAPGLLQLGATNVTLDALAAAAGPLAQVGSALAPHGDLLLYGCDVGQGVAGAAFVAALAELTGADVAASTDPSGPATAGGNWRLERVTGTVEAAPVADDGFGTLALVTGTTGDDMLRGTYDDDTLRGGDGDDVLEAYYGNDSLDGGTGNDTLSGDYFYGGNATLAGGSGNDTLWLSRRPDSYPSSPRYFTARGDAGDDTFNISSVQRFDSVLLTGGTGRDTYHFDWVEPGAVTITDFAAGAGGDRIDVEWLVTNDARGSGQGGNPFAPGGLLRLAQDGADATIHARQPDGTYTLMITLKNVRASALGADNFVGGFLPDGTVMPGETQTGTEYGNALEGGLFGDSLSGLGGDDRLTGNGGHDTLDGGDGDDVLYGSGGDDRQLGGNGADTLYGQHGGDTLLGGADADQIDGEAGSDSIDGGSGDDRLTAALAGDSDTLRGGEGNDTFQLSTYIPTYGPYVTNGRIDADGGAGDDLFRLQSVYGPGMFVLTGGSGHDLYQFDEALANDSRVVITDFTAGAGGDRIDLAQMLAFRERAAGFMGGNPFGSEQPLLRLVQSGADTLLQAASWWEAGKWNTLAQLQNVTAGALTADNFVDGLDPTGNPMPGDAFSGSDAGNGINGGMFDDTLAGNGGNDALYGAGGADRLDGGTGDDSLDGGAGDDTVAGGTGNDSLTAGKGSDVLDGGEGADRLNSTLAGKARHVLQGGAGDDTLAIVTDLASDGSTLAADGGAGADTFLLSLGTAPTALTLTGGDGADTYLFQSRIAGTVTISDFGADDVIDVRTLVQMHSGYHGGNPFSAASGTLRLVQQGDDTLVQHSPYGGPFGTVITLRDTVAASLTAANFAGYGPDGAGIRGAQLNGSGRITGTLQDDTITGGSTADELLGEGGSDVLHGGSESAGGDWLLGGYGDDTLYGEGGADTLDGNEGNDLLSGGDGNDTIGAWSGSDTLQGGGGDDQLTAHTSAILDGGTGNDTLRADMATGQGKVRALALTGGAGRDLFDIGAESWVTLDGTPVVITDFQAGAGGDWLDFSRLSTWSTWWPDPFSQGFRWVQEGADTLLQWNLGASQGAYRTILVLQNVEAARITEDNYRGLTLTANWTVNGGPGRDSLTGSDWGDVLTGGLGADTMTGGAGDDMYNVDGNQDTIIELPGGGTDSIQSTGSASLPAQVENGWLLAGGTLTGNAGDNQLQAYNEGATLAGVGGNDTLIGSHLDDLLQGGAGNDSMTGADGSDTVEAGSGIDTVSGGFGDDTLVLLGARAAYTVQVTLEGLRLINTSTGEDIVSVEVERFVFTDGVQSIVELSAVLVGAGNDLLVGTADADTLDGLGGADTMAGGYGDDLYVVDGTGDVVIEYGGEGTDTVDVAFTKAGRYLLPDDVENAAVTAADPVAVDIEGNLLDNRLTGNGAANRLTGGDGRDTLIGGAGNDTLAGGAGNDIYYVDAQRDVVIETADGGQDWVIVSGIGSYTLGAHLDGLAFQGTTNFTGTGNALDNLLRGGSGNDRLDGGAGDDGLFATPGSDTLLGGAGNDTMAAFDDGGNLLFDGGAGTDEAQFEWNLVDVRITRPAENDVLVTHIATGTAMLIRNAESFWFGDVKLSLAEIRAAHAGPGVDVLNGTPADDRLDGAGGNDQLWGAGGNDTLDGGTGADKLDGGTGNDTYYVDAAGDKVTELANEGTDTIITTLAKYTLGANLENVTYTGNAAFAATGNALGNVITAGIGNDVIDGAGGDDTYVLQGAFADYTRQRPNANDLVLVKGAQKITLKNIEQVRFSDGIKSLADLYENVASVTNDTLTGTDGADQMNGLAGADQLSGLAGDDTYVIDNLGDTVIERVDEGIDTVNIAITGKGTVTLGDNVEHATITSTAALNVTGNAEANRLTGNGAANALGGGDGNDTLIGGKGSDTLTGGAGDDFYSVDATGDKVVEAEGGGYDIVDTTVTKYTLSAHVEELHFTGKGAFTGSGNALANVIIGGAGNDKLTGGAGADTFVIGAGNDTITDFISGVDHLRLDRAIVKGEFDTVTLDAPGGFSSDTELVIFTQQVKSLKPADAAKTIGSATEGYADGDTALFVLHDAKSTGVFLFTSKGGDAMVSAGELVQIATLTGVSTVSPTDFQ